jgi:hypothetical protein
MPSFLIALQGDGFTDQRIDLERSPGFNGARGGTLGCHSLAPHGQAMETLETLFIDLGPLNGRWLKCHMRIHEESTKKLFVLL